jgi:hypothetical protein
VVVGTFCPKAAAPSATATTASGTSKPDPASLPSQLPSDAWVTFVPVGVAVAITALLFWAAGHCVWPHPLPLNLAFSLLVLVSSCIIWLACMRAVPAVSALIIHTHDTQFGYCAIGACVGGLATLLLLLLWLTNHMQPKQEPVASSRWNTFFNVCLFLGVAVSALCSIGAADHASAQAYSLDRILEIIRRVEARLNGTGTNGSNTSSTGRPHTTGAS